MRDCEFVDEAAVPGDLFDFGEFTGAVFEPNAESKVYGEVFRLPVDANALTALDKYEGYIPQEPEKSLFVRQIVSAETNDGQQLDCWVYQVNRSVVKQRAAQE